jgi:hypothetical protein
MGYYSRICTIDDYNTTDVKMGMQVAYIFGRRGGNMRKTGNTA